MLLIVGEPPRAVTAFDERYARIEGPPAGMTGEILDPDVVRTMPRRGSPHRFSAWRVPAVEPRRP
jgi:hypothetical protein